MQFVLIFLILSNVICLNFNQTDIVLTLDRSYQWIKSVSDNGSFAANTGQDEFDLYSGSSGVLLFTLEYYLYTHDSNVLNFSRSIADNIISSWETKIKPTFDISLFHHGASGITFVFHHLYEIYPDKNYLTFATMIDELIVDSFSSKEQEYSTMRQGAAGTGAYLICLLETFPHHFSDVFLTQIRESLISGAKLCAQMGEEIGTDKIKFFDEGSSGIEAPNYAHGTSGVGHFFSRFYQHMKTYPSLYNNEDPSVYLDIAIKGGNYLVSVANTSVPHNDGCLIFHSDMTHDDAAYYLGECSGPSGTGKFFLYLCQVSGDDQWCEYAKKGANSILYYYKTFNWWISKTKTYFWDNLSCCCGSCGVLQFLSLMNQYYPNIQVLEQAIEDIVENTLQRRVLEEGENDSFCYWEQAEYRTKPDFKTLQVGLYQGAAGISMQLMFLINPSLRIPLPDFYW